MSRGAEGGEASHPAEDVHDWSADFAAIRSTLVHADGRRYADYVQHIRPRFAVVWRDIGLGYAMLAAAIVTLAMADSRSWQGVAMAALASIWAGYWLAYLLLFLHEAAHYNIWPTRRVNDLLANIFIGLLFGIDIRSYRAVHFEHHRHLGTVRDPERSYFNALTPRFIGEALAGVHVIRVLLSYRAEPSGGRAGPAIRPKGIVPLRLGTVALHGGLLIAALVAGRLPLAAGWAIAIGSIFPFCSTVRQVLEHRSVAADPRTDYRLVDHGATARMFADGPFSSTFGGAGFNRHLLHHWEAQVSYTRLKDLERFLGATSVAPVIGARRRSYAGVFAALLRSARS